MALVRYARNEAVSRSVPVEIRIDSQRGAYGVTGGYGLGRLAEGTDEHVLPKELVFDFRQTRANEGDTVSILFGPDGTVDDESPMGIRIMEREGEFLRTLHRDAVLGYAIPAEGTTDVALPR